MKKRVWIKVDKLRLSEFKATRILGAKNNKKYALGNLEVGSQGFVVNAPLFTLREEDSLSQNYAQGKMRFLDAPINYRLRSPGRHPRRQILGDVIALAVANEYLRKRKEELLPLFNNSGDNFSFPWFAPPEWPKPLRIPVDFIRLFSFSARNDGPIFANVQIGHHLIFWNVEVYNPRAKHPFQAGTKEIRDKRILSIIKKMLSRPKNKEHLKRMSHYECVTSDLEIVDQVPGCNRDSLPPRICFY